MLFVQHSHYINVPTVFFWVVGPLMVQHMLGDMNTVIFLKITINLILGDAKCVFLFYEKQWFCSTRIILAYIWGYFHKIILRLRSVIRPKFGIRSMLGVSQMFLSYLMIIIRLLIIFRHPDRCLNMAVEYL